MLKGVGIHSLAGKDLFKRMGLGGAVFLQFPLFCRIFAVPFRFWRLDGSGGFLWRAASADRLCLEGPFSCRGALLMLLGGLAKSVPHCPTSRAKQNTPAIERPPAETLKQLHLVFDKQRMPLTLG